MAGGRGKATAAVTAAERPQDKDQGTTSVGADIALDVPAPNRMSAPAEADLADALDRAVHRPLAV